jgi:CD109 antigen
MSKQENYSRRKFIKMAGLVTGSAALTPLIQACGETPLELTATPTTANPTASPTALVTGGPVPTPTPIPSVMPVGSPVDSYLALAPGTLRAGQTEKVSVTLFSGANLGSDTVQVALLSNGGQKVVEASGLIQGRGEVALNLPKLADGSYTLQLNTATFQAQSAVKVEQAVLLFVESDKPIYKPGQDVHIRVLTLDPQLKPLAAQAVTVEIADAKGTKIYKKNVTTDDYGMATVDMPVSTEPNLGVWKVTATSGKIKTPLDLRIEKYVLPKYEVTITPAKEWVMADEKITGTIKAEYSYGKPVEGEVQIRATRYVGTWQEFASLNQPFNGQTSFQLPAVQYVAGTPASGGQGNITIEVTVQEKSTGYEEKATQLLTVVAAPFTLKVIPDSVIFKPGLPLSLLVVAETPDKKPVDASTRVEIVYTLGNFGNSRQSQLVEVKQGLATMQITPPADAISLTLQATSGKAYTSLGMQAGYSPTGSFIHLSQESKGPLKVGDTARFKIAANKQSTNFYYEVVARGMLVYSSFSATPDLAFTLTPQMASSARLLVYQILPNAEVAADYLPFTVEASYPHKVQASFDKAEVEPGQEVNLSLQTEGQAKVGLAVVDRSVFILAENRLNLQQVFDELEKLYLKPQVELHSLNQGYNPLLNTLSSKEIFGNAGVVVLSNKTIPQGKSYNNPVVPAPAAGVVNQAAAGATTAAATTAAAQAENKATDSSTSTGLAEVQRVRQFFPETWVWSDLTTDATGKVSKKLNAPDSITTWMLNAVALSPKNGLGITQAELKVLQPFFVSVDLVYSAIRGEQFPVKVALYNYSQQTEDFTVELDRANWFDLLGQASQTITVGPNDVKGVAFTIKPNELGTQQLKITARSKTRADAVIKDLLIEPEGVAREIVENLVVSPGQSYELDLEVPQGIIPGSARAYLAATGNFMTQTIEGLESLLKMPYGCGEQNMILFAPNVYVAQYLKESGQLKPEVMAKAESLMVTGYQRELTYWRTEGSFSAFGNSDKEGSLWLSAFVLKTFAQAKDLIFVDDSVLSKTGDWIGKQQKADGSFAPVGFVHHQDLLGGLKSNTALTAYLAVTFLEAGDKTRAAKAIAYLEGALPNINDAYTLAITAYALELAKSNQANTAYQQLLKMAQQSQDGTYWGDSGPVPPDPQPNNGAKVAPLPPQNQSAVIETTGYALLALTAHGDRIVAAQAARWLVSKRNAYGGWNSTQDTVVGLQALSKFVAGNRADVDATLSYSATGWQKDIKITPDNADVLQTTQVQTGGKVKIEVKGKGQAVVQAVRRFNVPDPARKDTSVFQINVDYGVTEISVNDQIKVSAKVQYTPPEPLQAGMVVLDVALPTGFSAVTDTLVTLAKQQPKLKRYDTAGRKVILYIEDMAPNETLQLEFQAVALYPIKAQAVTSQAYSYYRPDWKGESLGGAIVVNS